MPRSRIEGLLSSFPKLIKVGDQHTFIETDSVRFVYQPLDNLYIILITNKNSNILQDIDTLALFRKVISEYCKSNDEREIAKQAFELILIFDEVISLGFRENVNLGQIKTISAMESNDERIEAERQKIKEREAKEESKRRAQLMDLKKYDQRQSARLGIVDHISTYTTPQPAVYTPPVQDYVSKYSSSAYNSSSTAPSRGMKLGKKSAQSSLLDMIKQEEGVSENTTPIVIAKKEQSSVPNLKEAMSQSRHV